MQGNGAQWPSKLTGAGLGSEHVGTTCNDALRAADMPAQDLGTATDLLAPKLCHVAHMRTKIVVVVRLL